MEELEGELSDVTREHTWSVLGMGIDEVQEHTLKDPKKERVLCEPRPQRLT